MDRNVETLAAEVESRINSSRGNSRAVELKGTDAIRIVEIACTQLVAGLQRERSFVALMCSIGAQIREEFDLPRDSIKAAHNGAFVLETFEENGFFTRDLRQDGKEEQYFVEAGENDEDLTAIWTLIKPENNPYCPNFEPLECWESGIHANGLPLVRHAPMRVLDKLSPENQPIVFGAVNKAQRTGWAINADVLKVYVACTNDPKKAMFDGEYAFSYLDPKDKREQRASKKREVNTIKRMAKLMGEHVFFHQYNCDFRGRVYPTTAYLNEQSSDNAKGLLLLADGEELGENGLKWLSIHAANSYGEDKLTLEDRVKFTEDNKLEWISYAEDPVNNKGWIKADKCWSFLACCFEFKRIRDHFMAGNTIESFVSHLPVFIDGSNNGVQHLTALSRDESVAHLVNLVPTELPGDIYMEVADKCWEQVRNDVNPEVREEYEMFRDRVDEITSRMDELHEAYKVATQGLKGTEKAELYEQFKADRKVISTELADFRKDHQEALKDMAASYWSDVDDRKTQRKVAKRPVMTLGYGGTKFGFKDMVLKDTKKLGDHFRVMQIAWARYFGDLIYDVCMGSDRFEAALPGPARMLELFRDVAGNACDEGGKFSWTVPVTNFPVVQQYKQPETKTLNIKYSLAPAGKLQLTIRITENSKVKKSKQKTAAAPNVVHSLDAAHLQLTVNACDFTTCTVHDSFGCNAGDMEDMFRIVRERFVALYEADPLLQILREQGREEMMPVRGNLDLREVLKSDFAFV